MKIRHFVSMIGMIGSVVLMVVALWAWMRAGSLSSDLTRPEVGRWAVRSAAVAASAVAQLVLLTFAVGVLPGGSNRPRSIAADMLRLSAGLVAGIASISAVALGLAGR